MNSLLPAALLALAAVAALIGAAYARQFMPIRAASAPVPGRATLGVHTLVGQEEERADPLVRTRPLASAAQGSSFIAFSAGYATNDAAPRDNYGNRWQRLGAPVVYRGYDGAFDVSAFVVLDGRGGPAHRIELDKPGNPAGELTLPVVEIRDASRLVDVAQVYAPTGTRLESGSVTTDGPALLVAFWFGDGRGLRHSAVPDNGFRIIEDFTRLPPNSAVQSVVAVREVTQAGTWRVNWSTAPAQGAPLWLFAFAPAPMSESVPPR
jgi:hypothetical protein